jgi:tetratricopeptide (TPR) repeat protein
MTAVLGQGFGRADRRGRAGENLGSRGVRGGRSGGRAGPQFDLLAVVGVVSLASEHENVLIDHRAVLSNHRAIRRSPLTFTGARMKAFLSHSSLDKDIVGAVFEGLGAASSVYDAETFEEGKRSAEEIIRGLSIADVFVLFLSRNSVSSVYVQSEIGAAIEKVFKGDIRAILIFAIDDTHHDQLPSSLRAYTVDRSNKPAQIVRRIRSRLIELQLAVSAVDDIFIGRESEMRELQRALTLPPDEMRPAISIAGWQGLGRRTVVRRSIQMVFPYLKREQPVVVLDENDAIEEFHRKLFDCALGISRTSQAWSDAIARFSEKNYRERIDILLELIKTIVMAKEILFIVGDSSLVKPNGEFQPYVRDLLSSLGKTARPQIVLAHRRRVPMARQAQHPTVSFFSINSFSDDEATELLGAHLKQRDISYTREDLTDLVRFVGGHPENIKIAAEYARQYGMPQLRREKAEFTDIVVFRALEIMRRIEVSELAKILCVALIDFRYLKIEDFISLIDASDAEILAQLRFLEDNAMLERTGEYYRISPHLVEAISRADFGQNLASWRKKAGEKMLVRFGESSRFDEVSISLINSAALTAIRTGKYKGPGMLAQFLLPSHLLTIARESYDNAEYREASRLCREAILHKERLAEEAQIEAYRLLAMSSLRSNDREAFQDAVSNVQKYRGKIAKRNYHFLTGLQCRFDGFIDRAESEFRNAFNIDRRNFHVLRELAHVLALEGRFQEAENYARVAYEMVPTNPFIIDILCEVLIGKQKADELRKDIEVPRLLVELEKLVRASERGFHEERRAQYFQRIGDHEAAWEHANRAVASAPRHFGPRLTRINVAVAQGRLEKLNEDISALEGLNSESKASRFIIDRVKVQRARLRGDLGSAKAILAASPNLPSHVRRELTSDLASFERSRQDTDQKPTRRRTP